MFNKADQTRFKNHLFCLSLTFKYADSLCMNAFTCIPFPACRIAKNYLLLFDNEEWWRIFRNIPVVKEAIKSHENT